MRAVVVDVDVIVVVGREMQTRKKRQRNTRSHVKQKGDDDKESSGFMLFVFLGQPQTLFFSQEAREKSGKKGRKMKEVSVNGPSFILTDRGEGELSIPQSTKIQRNVKTKKKKKR